MKELPIIVSVFSHAFFNPLLFSIVRRSLILQENKRRKAPGVEEVAPERLIRESQAYGYITQTIACYAFFATLVFVILFLSGLTRSIGSFIDAQYNYSSPWRTAIVAVMAARIYIWATMKNPWDGLVLLMLPLSAASCITQIVLFFRHLY